MPLEPAIKRAIAFVDGQNLFYAAKEAFGYRYPNYDIAALAAQVCASHNWQLQRIYFYTGIPDVADNPFWNYFWVSKLSAMGRQNVQVFSRPLRYRNQSITLPDGTTRTVLVGQEKGIDIRIALDIVRHVRQADCDVILVLSQDQDLSEVAAEVRTISIQQQRWIKIASAYPDSPTRSHHRGIDRTDWIRIDRATYDACLDNADHRPPSSGRP